MSGPCVYDAVAATVLLMGPIAAILLWVKRLAQLNREDERARDSAASGRVKPGTWLSRTWHLDPMVRPAVLRPRQPPARQARGRPRWLANHRSAFVAPSTLARAPKRGSIWLFNSLDAQREACASYVLFRCMVGSPRSGWSSATTTDIGKPITRTRGPDAPGDGWPRFRTRSSAPSASSASLIASQMAKRFTNEPISLPERP